MFATGKNEVAERGSFSSVFFFFAITNSKIAVIIIFSCVRVQLCSSLRFLSVCCIRSHE